jgi:hypothetical protein
LTRQKAVFAIPGREIFNRPVLPTALQVRWIAEDLAKNAGSKLGRDGI